MIDSMIVLYENGKVTDAATKTAGIYYWKNNLNGKGYVGKSLNVRKRTNGHISGINRCTDGYNEKAFYVAVRKYGIENFTCYKVMDCCPSNVALNYWERHWIKELDTFGRNGYNETTGGDGGEFSEATKKKISDALRGHKLSAETRKKISDAHRGKKQKPLSAESRAKISEARRGKKLSVEHRNRIADAKRGHKHSAETRKKIGDASRRIKRSEEWCRKISISLQSIDPERRKKLNEANSLRVVSAEVRAVIRRKQLLRWGTLYKDFFIYDAD